MSNDPEEAMEVHDNTFPKITCQDEKIVLILS